MTKNFIKLTNNIGQGLIEALIAVSIILAAIISTLTLIISSINAGRVSIDKLIAASLAREGIEIVRNIRDGNWIDPSGVDWSDGIIATNDNTAIPIIDEIPPSGLPLSYKLDFAPVGWGLNCGGSFDCMRIYSKGSLYLQKTTLDSSWQATKYYRLLYINRICWEDSSETEKIIDKSSPFDCTSFDIPGETYSEVGVRVISEVRWPTSNSTNNIKIEERIYNWRP